MARHEARCRCGQVRIVCEGEPVRVSVCHCGACKQRSGSAFAAQARFAAGQVSVTGETGSYVHVADSGNKARFHFCPTCGANLHYVLETQPDVVAVPIGLFDEPAAFTPRFSVWEERMLPWVAVMGEDVEHSD